MRAVIQRVGEARVTVDGTVVGAIGAGLLVLLGVATEDGPDDADRLARKISRLRIFESDEGKLDLSVVDTGGEALVVSQFTLLADSRRQKGTRPDFSKAARPEIAEPLYERFCEALRELRVPVQTGIFGAKMAVALVNDGPVTIILDVERHLGGTRIRPDPDQLREFAERYTEAWCSGNPARVAENYAPDGSLTINGGTPSVGRAAITEAAKSFMAAFPDMQVLLDRVGVAEGGGEYHWTLVGTNTGAGGTGNRVRIGGYEEWTIGDDGLIAESQGHYDQAEYDRQVAHGVDEPR